MYINLWKINEDVENCISYNVKDKYLKKGSYLVSSNSMVSFLANVPFDFCLPPKDMQ